MDENEEKLSKFDFNFDLMIVNVFFIFIFGFKNVGVVGVDLFIGVMLEESCNMMVCMLVINMGVKKIVVWIDNYEYLFFKYKEFFF